MSERPLVGLGVEVTSSEEHSTSEDAYESDDYFVPYQEQSQQYRFPPRPLTRHVDRSKTGKSLVGSANTATTVVADSDDNNKTHHKNSSASTIKLDENTSSSGQSRAEGENDVQSESHRHSVGGEPLTAKQDSKLGNGEVDTENDATAVPRPSPLLTSSSTPNIALTAPVTKRGNMTVEAETVSAVPTVAVAAAGGSGSLRVKKSIDSVPKVPNRTSAKKKKSRLGQGTKTEVFAAKIASAVDEAQSSDSEETFVYESNPQDHSNSSTVRPRFQSRNPSTSSIAMAASASASTPSQQLPNQIAHTSSENGLPVYNSRWVVHKHRNNGPELPVSSSSSLNNFNGDGKAPGGLTPIINQGPPAPAPAPGPGPIVNSGTTGTGNGRNSLRRHSSQYRPMSPRPDGALSRPHSPLPLEHRRSKRNLHNSSRRVIEPDASTRAKDAAFRRWRGGGNYVTEEDEDEIDDSQGEIDYDDDGYEPATETTPLRHSDGRSIRRSRKNGVSFTQYSPHNYQRGGGNSRLYYVRVMFWLTLVGILVLACGFIMGFLLATSKPLQDVRVSQIFDILVSDDVLAFELVVEASNPGYLGIEVENVDLDLFAKSSYVKDAKLADKMVSELDAGDDEAHTMLLGNVHKFDVPLIFEGGIFNRRLQKAVADVKLANPGQNVTVGDQLVDYFDLVLNESGEKDDGQRKWSRVNVHKFELILRGSLKYKLLLGRSCSVAIAKTVNVDPAATLND